MNIGAPEDAGKCWAPSALVCAGPARGAGERRDFDGIVEAAASAAPDDEHDPEARDPRPSRRQHVAALIGQARDQLADIARALERLAEGRYGQCERCGRAIAPERLAARPAASTCITCAIPGR